MKKLSMMISVAIVEAAYSTVAVAAVEYTYENDGKTYVATVTGSATEISGAAIAVLNDNAVTNFIKRGDKNLTLYNGGANNFTGDVVIENASIAVSRQNPLGPSGRITIPSQKALIFSEATVAKDVRLAGGAWDGGATKISVWAGVSRLDGKLIFGKHTDGKGYDVGVVGYEGSQLTFAGGVEDEDRNAAPWPIFQPAGGSTVVFENKPVNIVKPLIIMPNKNYALSSDGFGGRIVFSVAGNRMAHLGYDDGSSDRRMNWCDLKTTVDYAFDTSSFGKVYIGHDSRWDLYGTSQRIGQLDVKANSGSPSVITNSLQTPATLYAKMMYGNNGAPNIRIGGNLSVVFEGNIWDSHVGYAMTATGDLIIEGNGGNTSNLHFDKNGSWANAMNIVVKGNGKVTVANSGAFGRQANVKLASNASLEIASGVTVNVKTLTVGGVQKPAGEYTFGGGKLHVSHPCGFILIVK